MEGGEARIVAYTKVFAIRARLDKRVRYITDGEKTSLASSITYHFDGPDAGLFGRPTSDDTIYVTMDKPVNTDRSKNAAYIPPAFGSPTSTP